MRPRTLERVAGASALAAMFVTPFVPARGRRRVALTWATVVAGATRTWAIERRGRGTAAATATAGGIAAGALVAEVWGTRRGRLFGRYAYTGRLRPLVGGVPPLVPLAWYAVLLPARAVADRALACRSSPLTRVGVGALATTAWDLFLDPQMTVEGYWRWARGGSYRGVPIRNFVGWFVVAAGLLALLEATDAMFAAERDTACDGANDRASDTACDTACDDAHLITYGSLGVLETVVFSTFWRDPLVAAAGGIGMLPLAGTAWARSVAARRK